MPPRTSLRDRLPSPPGPPRGREAIYDGAHAETPPEPPPRRGERRLISWEEAHKRVTFYCSLELIRAVEAEMRRSRRTKTQVIVDALTDHLVPHHRSEGEGRSPGG